MKKSEFCLFFISIWIAVEFISCAAVRSPSAPAPPTYFPAGQWRTSTPERQGIDSESLAETISFIREKKLPVHSLMMVKNGYVVLDAYFHPYSKKRLHDVASVTKSITTSLIGLAHEKGFIEELDQPIVDYFPEYQSLMKNQKITIRDLLTMTSGFDCGYGPGETELYAMIASPNWVAFALQMEMKTTPGTEFSYCSNGMHLLSAIVSRSTKRSTFDFAKTNLFEPLGIKNIAWPTDPQEVNLGGGNIRLHPHDMAKIGYLFLAQGQWNGRQILSSDWVRQATKRQIDDDRSQEGFGYGFGWWIFSEEYHGMYGARGRGGQEIIVWPQYNLVLVMTAGGTDIGDFEQPLLNAFKSNEPVAENKLGMKKLRQQIQLAATSHIDTSLRPSPVPEAFRKQSGRVYRLDPNRMGLRTLSLKFDANGDFYFKVSRQERHFTMKVGLDGNHKYTENGPSDLPVMVNGLFRNSKSLLLKYREVGGINNLNLNMEFNQDQITIQVDDPTGYMSGEIRGHI